LLPLLDLLVLLLLVPLLDLLVPLHLDCQAVQH
jgi:hypothetical protein